MRLIVFAIALAGGLTAAAGSASIDIDLTEQKAYLLHDGIAVAEASISSGRRSYPTPTGDFSVIDKNMNHYSSQYGKIVDANGRTVVADADSSMRVPPGGKFVRAPMKYFIRFRGGYGLHAGYVPGYPASHGCVRLPQEKAELFFQYASAGTPVRVYGRAPAVYAAPITVEAKPRPTVERKRRGFLGFGKNERRRAARSWGTEYYVPARR